MAMLANEIKQLTPEQKRAHAREVVTSYAGTEKKSGGFHSATSFRTHFDTQKMIILEKQLGVDFQKLIDEMLRDGTLQVTNGIVWVRK